MGEPDEYFCIYCRAHIKEDCECEDRNEREDEEEKPSRIEDKGGFLGCGFPYVPGDPHW